MSSSAFSGDKKVGQSLLHSLEQKAIAWTVPKIPHGIETYHLTLTTIPICIFILLFSYLAKNDLRWLWGVSVMILAQYITDSLDGSLGRYRQTGLIKWGYYMDHFLDYIFLCSILTGYSLMLPDAFKDLQFFLLIIFGAFMVNAYLAFAATNEFRISYLGVGPTEVRLIFIAVNTLLILLGRTHLARLLPFVLIFSFLGLCMVVYQTQKRIWNMDMEQKRSTHHDHAADH
ncbi:MAG: hypothetical protein Q7N87_03035 [Candidatus Uhrbacteria bacterium]|nr:hypothetical protein [Candidatus Uhrbacteria bacterium]